MATDYHGILWEDKEIPVFVPEKGGVWYPRIFSDSGRLYCAFDYNEPGKNTVIAMVYSDDGGYSWSSKPVTVSCAPGCNCANAAFTVLDGEMLIAYRAVRREGDRFSVKLMVSSSIDRINWKYHSTIIEEDNDGFFGVWEPHFGFMNGRLAVFYANNSRRVVASPSMQNIEYKLWDENSRTWSEAKIVSDGNKTKSRDGMPVWCERSGGGYVLAIEATDNQPRNPFVLKLLTSPDGDLWSASRQIYRPEKEGRKAAAPYVLELPDGRLAVSFQTDEDSTNAGDAYSIMKVIVSNFSMKNAPPVRDDFCPMDFEEPFVPFDTPDGYNSMWNGLYLDGQTLFACTSTNYPRSMIKIRRADV